MLRIELNDITQENLDDLVANQIQEGTYLDFKREIPLNWDARSKQDFLSDVSSFANAFGGDIIYGIDEVDSFASQIVPMALSSVDAEIRRMQDFLVHNIEPRIFGVDIRSIQVNSSGVDGHVVIVRIPKSWSGPHRVKTNNHFYIREGIRSRQIDVPELRAMFLGIESQLNKVKNFRHDRVGKVLIGESPCKLVDGPTILLHIVPIAAYLNSVQVDPTVYLSQRQLPVLHSQTGNPSLNLDGALSIRNPSQHGTHGYSQFFRDGFFESVTVLTPAEEGLQPAFHSLRQEQAIISLINQFRVEQELMGIVGDLIVMISITRAKNIRFLTGESSSSGNKFDRDVVAIPDVILSQYQTVEEGLKPLFDLLWQSVGSPKSNHYDENGVRLSRDNLLRMWQFS